MTDEQHKAMDAAIQAMMEADPPKQADLVVCKRIADGPAIFDDDEYGECAACGAAIRFRPYMPKGPPKVCVGCALAYLAAKTEAPAP